MPSIRVKVCCIESEAELRAAVAAGASALGFVSAMPSGPGVITDREIEELVPRVPPFVVPVLLTSLTGVDEIVAQAVRCRARAVQLCSPLGLGELAKLRRRLPGVAWIPVVHVVGPESVEEAMSVQSESDAILLDTGVRTGPDRQLGGTGRTHDWMQSREIVRRVRCPVILAGGLHEGNVAAAIAQVGPWAVDVCSGVRSQGRLDDAKLAAFVRAVRSVEDDAPWRS